MGLSAALGIAGRALEVFSTGLQVAGQNISNASTPGYIREELKVTPAPSYGAGGLVLGSGVQAQGVIQQVDKFLQVRIQSANSDFSASDARNTVYTQLQSQINELGDNDLSTQVSNFLAAINNLSNQPESSALTQQVVSQGTQLASFISSLRTNIDKDRQDQNVNVDQLVSQANTLIQDIANLNPQISKLEASGLLQSQAGSLRDQRYQDLNQLSQIIPITFQERGDGSVDVFSGSDFLILAGKYQQLETVTSGDRNVPVENVQLSITHSQLDANSAGGGQLRGVLQGRDTIMGGFVDNLDQLTSSIISEFNNIYSSGEGKVGFTSVTATNAVTNAAAALNQPSAGLAFPPQHGSFQVKVTDQSTGITKTSTVNVDLDGVGSDTSLNDLVSALNGIGNVSASITADGRLKIDAGSNYDIRFSNDTSHTLAALGINTFFTGSDSGNIGINSVVQNNLNLFAASKGGGPSDGSNAVDLANFSSNAVSSLKGLSIDDYYNSIISDVAQKGSAETTMSNGLKDFRDSLVSQQQQYSGVTLDEEAIKIMQYQQAYQAAARIVSTVDQLLQVLLKV